VDERLLRFKEIVLANRLPRRVELQHDVKLKEDGDVEYVEFEESFEGIIKSHIYHYRNTYEDVYHTWKEHSQAFRRSH
jgi:Peptidase family M49